MQPYGCLFNDPRGRRLNAPSVPDPPDDGKAIQRGLDPATYAILVLVIACTTPLAPFPIKSFYGRNAGATEPSISEPGHHCAGPAGD